MIGTGEQFIKRLNATHTVKIESTARGPYADDENDGYWVQSLDLLDDDAVRQEIFLANDHPEVLFYPTENIRVEAKWVSGVERE